MKKLLTSSARKLLPSGAIRKIESGYRKTRAKIIPLRYGRPAKKLRVIAITGTNGKTTTAHLINEVLKSAGRRTALFSTSSVEINGQRKANESHMTVDSVANMQKFFVRALSAQVDFVIIEFTSQAIHQHKLDGVPVELAIMTNLTQDHLDYHGTIQEYARVKAKLFQSKPRFIVLNRDDQWFDFFNQYPAKDKKLSYGKDPKSDFQIKKINLSHNKTKIQLDLKNQKKLEITTNLPGEHNAYNVAAAAAGGYLLGLKPQEIASGMDKLKSIPGRYQYIDNKLGLDIIVDYAHTPDGLEKLLQSSKKLAQKRMILVFGACGDRDKQKRPEMGQIATKYADKIILTDEENYTEDADKIRKDIYKGIQKSAGQAKTTEVADRLEAIKTALLAAQKGDTILITGLGHQTSRIIDGKSVEWHEPTVVQELIKQID